MRVQSEIVKRILYFSKTDRTGPSSRYRIFQFLNGLEDAGVKVKVSPLFCKFYFLLVDKPFFVRIPCKVVYTLWRFLVRTTVLLTAFSYDSLVIEHQLFPYFPSFFEHLLKTFGISFAIEFDDAIYLTRFHGRKMASLCKLADKVIVGNPILAEYARRFNSDAHVAPTVVNLDKYEVKKDYTLNDRRPVVGWIGLKYNFEFLKNITEFLPKEALFRVVSSSPPDLDNLALDFVPWSEEKEAEYIAGFDVGIMPLPDNEWARGKCGLKILQYMAAGVPVIASPVGVNSSIINDGVNGFLADSWDDWKNKTLQLLNSDDLRTRIGQAGRKTVESGYSYKDGIKILIDIYRKF